MSATNALRVLLVDDETINLKLLNALLGDFYTVNTALNGEQALQRAQQRPQPDLILLDVQMPGISGMEVCRRLKSDPGTRDIPILFITSMSNPESERRGLEMGAVDYITKPFSPPIVLARVKNHLELKQQRDLLRQLTFIDALTGIANRRRFDELLEFEWRRALRTGVPLSLIMLDVDHFKSFNDSYGHSRGDECLKRIAQAIEKGLKRSTDIVARFGGEEFACILPDTDHRGACQLAEYLRQKILDLGISHSRGIDARYVTSSMGVATMEPTSDLHPRELIDLADQRLYLAKSLARNQVIGAFHPSVR